MAYGDIDRGQLCLMYWFDAWRQQAIIWSNVDFSLVRFSGIHLRVILEQVPKVLFCATGL